MKILVVEDEESIASVLKQGLEEAGYTVDIARTGTKGLKMAMENVYAVIALDVMLPGVDGWTICSELRASRVNTPILMLTARDAVGDRVKGLETGADDYLSKPFDFDELIARMRALIRRDKIHKTKILKIADLEIDTFAHTAVRAGQPLALTQREYSLLEALASQEGRTLTRDVIQDRIWNNEESFSNTVDVHIGLLRKKVDADHKVKLIQTVHGLGYRLKAPEMTNSE